MPCVGRAPVYAAGPPRQGAVEWPQVSGWGGGVPDAFGLTTHQGLLYEEAEEDGIAHLPQALEHVCLELCILDDVLQLVVEELQDP